MNKNNCFQVVENQIARAYNQASGCSWSLKDCISLFRQFYQEYEANIGRKHPYLADVSVISIICKLDYVSDCYGRIFPLDPEDYPEIISAYFEQDFEDCNYSIAHFMSGDIRLNRCYEEGII